MIKINNKDSIIDIIKKIESSNKKEIILEFPIWNSILHNYTSLKLLKNKAWVKNLIIITNDINAKKIWKRLWIKYSILNDKSTIKNIDLLEYNYTFSEYLLFLLKSYYKEFKDLFSKSSNNTLFWYYKKKRKENRGIWFFIVWLISSLLLLLFVFYFAVNKTYITITPEITIKTRAKNFVFKEVINDSILNSENIIKLNPISKIVYLEEPFWTLWVEDSNNSKRSKWKVMIYNNLAEEIPLLNNTRLITNNWILYTIEWKITIPKAVKQENWKIVPWTIETNIVAKSFDNKWTYIWEKGNIWTWITLTFPWLNDLSKVVYAKSTNIFSWWNNNYTKIVWKDDLKNAEKLLEEKLKTYALKELKKQIKEDNEINNITYEILWIDKIINYSYLEINWWENIKVWEKRDNFTLNWTIKINTYTFNKELVINKLKATIRNSLLEKIEKINFINDQSLRLSNIIYQNKSPFEAKITAEIEVFYSLNFLSNTNNYIDKLKEKIAWINKKEALKILLNNSKISDVKIETRPFFIQKISSITKNIIFEVDEN